MRSLQRMVRKHILSRKICRQTNADDSETGQEERNAGTQVNISIMKKNKKFQKDQMTAEGYTEFVEFFKDRI